MLRKLFYLNTDFTYVVVQLPHEDSKEDFKVFEIKNVTRKFDTEYALRNVSLQINEGLNFIIGASGSGKTTLLKIISGMDQNFEGEVFYHRESVKSFTSADKSLNYGHRFGFIWQDFNLIEDLTVFDNIKIPLLLKEKPSKDAVEKVMKQLKINNLANQKVKTLSGGQKQRVAIARELIKNPEVIIADEPTAALDPKSAAITMGILKQLSKTKTVIIVTHDTSFIEDGSNVFEFDKGELISATQRGRSGNKNINIKIAKNFFSFNRAIDLAKTNFKSSMGRYIALMLTMFISASLLLVTLGGSVKSEREKTFQELVDNYGENILDVSLVGSFMSASGTEGNENDKPNADVEQDISALYDNYVNDERVEYINFLQALDNIAINVDGKSINIDSTGSSPVLNELIVGEMPSDDGFQVVVPESFVKKLGISNEKALGKEIEVNAAIYNWETGQPVLKDVKIKAVISGVADTTVAYEYNGHVEKVSIDDSFFFNKKAVEDIRNQAGIKSEGMNIVMRMKTPEDVISIKDELNKQGIVPLGFFELLENTVRLQSTTKEQSGSAVIIISLLAVFISLAIAAITALMRQKEIAIYKVSGYSKKDISIFVFAEYVLTALITAIAFVVLSPITNKVIKATFSTEVMSGKNIAIGVVVVLILAVICCGIGIIANSFVKEEKCLKSGER